MTEPNIEDRTPEGALDVFRFDSWRVRVIIRGGMPWWVLKDVCDVLGLSNPSMVLGRLREEDRAKFNLGCQGETSIINESGLFDVILWSNRPDALRFRHWITSEVVPSICKHGAYALPRVQAPTTLLDALRADTRGGSSSWMLS